MPHELKYWEAHCALEGLENQEFLGSGPLLTFSFLYLWAEHLDPPSDGITVIESCLASLLLLFLVALFAGASDLVQNKCLGACRRRCPSPQPPASAGFQGASCHPLRILPAGMQAPQPAQAHGQRDGERHSESWSGTKGAWNSKRGELFKEEHQSVRDGERAGNDRSGLKSHLSPSSYYVNYSCSLAAAAAEAIADIFWKHLLHAKTPGLVPCSRRGVGGRDAPHCVPGQ